MNLPCRCGTSGGHERPGKGDGVCKEKLSITAVFDAANSISHYIAVLSRKEQTE